MAYRTTQLCLEGDGDGDVLQLRAGITGLDSSKLAGRKALVEVLVGGDIAQVLQLLDAIGVGHDCKEGGREGVVVEWSQ